MVNRCATVVLRNHHKSYPDRQSRYCVHDRLARHPRCDHRVLPARRAYSAVLGRASGKPRPRFLQHLGFTARDAGIARLFALSRRGQTFAHTYRTSTRHTRPRARRACAQPGAHRARARRGTRTPRTHPSHSRTRAQAHPSETKQPGDAGVGPAPCLLPHILLILLHTLSCSCLRLCLRKVAQVSLSAVELPGHLFVPALPSSCLVFFFATKKEKQGGRVTVPPKDLHVCIHFCFLYKCTSAIY